MNFWEVGTGVDLPQLSTPEIFRVKFVRHFPTDLRHRRLVPMFQGELKDFLDKHITECLR